VADDWHRLSPADTRTMLANKGVRRIRDHDMTRQILNWRCCRHCGLLGLKNEATRQALRAKCITYEDAK